MAFKKNPHEFSPYRGGNSKAIFRKEVEKDDGKVVEYFEHVPDDSVIPKVPSPETFRLDNCIRSGKNLEQVPSEVLVPGDPVEANNQVENFMNHEDAKIVESQIDE